MTRMFGQLDWLMVPFAIFYLMLAALAVAVWVQLRGAGIKVPARRQPPQAGSRAPIDRRASSQHAQFDRAPRPPAG
jgi:hypothetical protein